MEDFMFHTRVQRRKCPVSTTATNVFCFTLNECSVSISIFLWTSRSYIIVLDDDLMGDCNVLFKIFFLADQPSICCIRTDYKYIIYSVNTNSSGRLKQMDWIRNILYKCEGRLTFKTQEDFRLCMRMFLMYTIRIEDNPPGWLCPWCLPRHRLSNTECSPALTSFRT